MLAVIIPGPPSSHPLATATTRFDTLSLARRQQKNPARSSPPRFLLVKPRLKSQIKKSSYAPRCRSSVVSLISHCRGRKGRNRADDAVSAPLLKVLLALLCVLLPFFRLSRAFFSEEGKQPRLLNCTSFLVSLWELTWNDGAENLRNLSNFRIYQPRNVNSTSKLYILWF